MSTLKELQCFADLPNYYWTVDRYHAMIEAGVLNKNDKTELLAGKIVPKSHKSPKRARTRSILNRLFFEKLENTEFSVWPGLAVTLDNHSEPEPDLSIINRNTDTLNHKPFTEDLALVVEVTDHDIAKNSICKRWIYAKSGIQEYWIIDVYGQSVEQYLGPQEDGTYATINKFGKQDEIVSLELGSYLVSDLLA